MKLKQNQMRFLKINSKLKKIWNWNFQIESPEKNQFQIICFSHWNVSDFQIEQIQFEIEKWPDCHRMNYDVARIPNVAAHYLSPKFITLRNYSNHWAQHSDKQLPLIPQTFNLLFSIISVGCFVITVEYLRGVLSRLNRFTPFSPGQKIEVVSETELPQLNPILVALIWLQARP